MMRLLFSALVAFDVQEGAVLVRAALRAVEVPGKGRQGERPSGPGIMIISPCDIHLVGVGQGGQRHEKISSLHGAAIRLFHLIQDETEILNMITVLTTAVVTRENRDDKHDKEKPSIHGYDNASPRLRSLTYLQGTVKSLAGFTEGWRGRCK
jgi:hypothetical protein